MGAQTPKLPPRVKNPSSKKLRCKSLLKSKSKHKGLRRYHLVRLRQSKDTSIVILDPIPPMEIQDLLVLHRTRAEIFPEGILWCRPNPACFQRWMQLVVLPVPHLPWLLRIITTLERVMYQLSTFLELKWLATQTWAIQVNPPMTRSSPSSPRAKVKHANIKPRIAYSLPMQPWGRQFPPLTSTDTPIRDMRLQFLIRTVTWTGLPQPSRGPVEMAEVSTLAMEEDTLGSRAILRA